MRQWGTDEERESKRLREERVRVATREREGGKVGEMEKRKGEARQE